MPGLGTAWRTTTTVACLTPLVAAWEAQVARRAGGNGHFPCSPPWAGRPCWFGRLAVLWPHPVAGWAGRGCSSSRRPTYGHIAANQSPSSGARTPSSAGVAGFPNNSVCDACTWDLRVTQGPTHMAAIGLLSGHICVSYRARVACPPTQCLVVVRHAVPKPGTGAPWRALGLVYRQNHACISSTRVWAAGRALAPPSSRLGWQGLLQLAPADLWPRCGEPEP